MNNVRLRAMLITAAMCAVASILVQVVLMTVLTGNAARAMTSPAFIAGWWTNLALAGTMAIRFARQAAAEHTDPRIGKFVGGATGFWAGMGALLGLVISSYFLASQWGADVRPGLVIVFGVMGLLVCAFAGWITGRETAHPPTEEEA